jgi:hypothetical protein
MPSVQCGSQQCSMTFQASVPFSMARFMIRGLGMHNFGRLILNLGVF